MTAASSSVQALSGCSDTASTYYSTPLYIVNASCC